MPRRSPLHRLGLSVFAAVLACTPDMPVPHRTGNPGRVPLRRWTGYEYERAVHDLLGTTLPLAAGLPPDDPGDGFDNDAALLTTTPQLLELYAQAARVAVADVLVAPDPTPRLQAVEAELADESSGTAFADWGRSLEHFDGPAVAVLPVDRAGTWQVVVRAAGHLDGGGPVRAAVTVAGKTLGILSISAPVELPQEYTLTVGPLEAGPVRVTVQYLADPTPTPMTRDLVLDWIGLYGPLDAPARNPRRAAILTCDPELSSCRRELLTHLARRAWRRPVTEAEAERLLAVMAASRARGQPADRAFGVALEAILTSPHFLLRVEVDPPGIPHVHDVSDHELATRLAAFLWSSVPDATLDSLADAGTLHQPEVLDAQVERMLGDAHAQALTEQVTGQWWSQRSLAEVAPDPVQFPAFDASLRAAMAMETRLFFQDLLAPGRPVTGMLTATQGYVNDRLAQQYGMPLPGSATPVLRELPSPRRGLLGQGSVLTVTSHSQRTSPTVRGKWVLSQLLCDAPPPPPPGVAALPTPTGVPSTARERLAVHSAHPACASCHVALDAIGLGLEPFDAIGTWRTHENGLPIDSHGQLPDGAVFAGPEDLAQLLAKDPRFLKCVVRKMTTYAVGRRLVADDEPFLADLHESLVHGGLSLRSLIHAIVQGPLFRQRGPDRGGL